MLTEFTHSMQTNQNLCKIKFKFNLPQEYEHWPGEDQGEAP